MANLWLPQFTRNTHNPYGFGYAPAFSNGRPVPLRANPLGVLHSTEGAGLPSYGGGKSNPNFTIDPWKKRRWQHVPANVAARALVAHNDAGTQVEVVGTCDKAWSKKIGGYYLPDLDEDDLTYLAESLALIGDALAIPATSSVRWLAYPTSYGSRSGQRLTTAQLAATRGWIGHQHVPGNDHGDPGELGAVIVPRLAALAKKTITTTATPSAPITLGSTGPRVEALQKAINAWYASRGWRSRLDVDGVAGARTIEAVKVLQGAWGLTADGIAGPATLAAIAKNWKVTI